MLLGIDHLVMAVRDPDWAVVELARRLGLRPGGGGTHPALGTRNRLLWLGDTYLVTLECVDPATSSVELFGIDWSAETAAGAALAPSATLR